MLLTILTPDTVSLIKKSVGNFFITTQLQNDKKKRIKYLQ